MSLGQLQLGALQALIPRMDPDTELAEKFVHVDTLNELAEDHGFEPLSVGSSRFVVRVDVPGRSEGIVAKLAWTCWGLGNSLAEAAVLLASPDQVRRHLAEGLVISEQLVFMVKRAELISPTQTASTDIGDPEWVTELFRAWGEWHEPINELRQALGVPTNNDAQRMDNYGLNRRGELVVLDFAEFGGSGISEAMVWLKLQDKPVNLDAPTRRRVRDDLREIGATPLPASGGLVSRSRLASAGISPEELTEKAGWVETWDEIEDHERAARGGSLT